MADVKQSEVEAKFKDNLLDMMTILEKIGPLCKSVDELSEMIKLAIDENSGQLKLLMLAMTIKPIR